MTISYPIPLADFWSTLPITRLEFSLPETAEVVRTAGGEVVTTSLGTRLWRAAVTLSPRTQDVGVEIQALLRLLRRPGATALIGPLVRSVPRLDPLGTLGAQLVTVSSIAADRTAFDIAGLPPGYTLSRGDYLSIIAPPSVPPLPPPAAPPDPVQHFHQIVSGRQADPGGSVFDIDVVPYLSPGIIALAPVTLIRPVMKAVLDPGSVREGAFERALLGGISFEMVQTLR